MQKREKEKKKGFLKFHQKDVEKKGKTNCKTLKQHFWSNFH